MDLSSTVIPAMSRAGLPISAAEVLTRPAPPDDFIVPSVTMKTGGFDPHKPLLLISAPGAVGKSALAHYMALRCNTMIWDLSRLVVGDNTFLGTVAKAFGTNELSSVLTAFQSGAVPFVFDALDEADILSGWARLERFVFDVAEQVARSTQPTALMFARSETAAMLDLVLSDKYKQSIHQVLEIDYFDEPRSRDFIRRMVARKHGSAHMSTSTPLEHAVTEVFSALAKAMAMSDATAWSTREGRGFLGYAPVLQAISAFLLDVDNLAGFSETTLHREASKDDRGLSTTIICELLNREHQKFANGLRGKQLPGSEGFDGWSQFYTVHEQIDRLLAYSDVDPAATIPQNDVPPWLAKEYAEALSSFLPNHPFIVNRSFAGPAFRDFAIASGLRADPPNARAERKAADTTYLPTPLLSAFYCELSSAPAAGAHVGILYESATGGAALGDESVTTFIGPDPDSNLHVLSITVGDNANPSPIGGLEVNVDIADTSPVVLRRRARNTQIETPGTVILGQADGTFELANSEIQCGRLEIPIRELQLRVPNTTDAITLSAATAQVPATPPLIQKYGTGTVRLSWPGVAAFPWTPYAWDPAGAPIDDLPSKLSALRSILRWFRRDKREEFAKHREHIDNNVVKDRPIRESVLIALLDHGVLTREAHLYVLHPDRASKYGIDWVNVVTHGRMNPQLAAFLNKA